MVGEREEDYDLLPHEEVTRLRREVDEIKQHPFGSSKEGKELLDSINRLSESMDHLTGLFQEAAEQMKLEEREAELIGKRLDPLFGRMDDLIEQNKRIAKGIIAVADMVKEAPQRQGMQYPRMGPQPGMSTAPGIRIEPTPFQSRPPQMQGNMGNIPRPSPPSSSSMPSSNPPQGMNYGSDLPPPPPLARPEKKGFFSFSK